MKDFPFNNIILASASPRRKTLLEAAGARFRVEVSGATEVCAAHCDSNPASVAVQNARLKARAVADNFPDEIVLGADTIVVLNGEILGKPKSVSDAENMLMKLSGNMHVVITAIALEWKNKNTGVFAYETSKVFFKNFGIDLIRDYMQKVDVMDKAGSYGIQEHGDMIVERIVGNKDNVMGLPCNLVKSELEKLLRDAETTR